MPNRCVAGGCSNFADVEKGIVLHGIPFLNDERPEAKKRRRKWVEFVKQKRAKWEPTNNSALCSLHFNPEDFMRRYALPDTLSNRPIVPRLVRDGIGVTASPSVHAKSLTHEETMVVQSSRDRRMSLKSAKRRLVSLEEEQEPEQDGGAAVNIKAEAGPSEADNSQDTLQDSFTQTDHDEEAKEECQSCTKLQSRNRQLRNQLITARSKIKKIQKELDSTKRALDESRETATEMIPEPQESENGGNDDGDDDFVDDSDSDDTMEEEPDFSSDANYDTSLESETDPETEAENEDSKEEGSRVYVKDENLRTQPKFIVFLSQLLILFRFCHTCKADGPLIEAKQVGTMVVVTSTCGNKNCQSRDVVWKSQPNMTGTKIPAGNFLLSFAILHSGGSASKKIQMFKHMGLRCFSLATFFRHQNEKLFPAIHLFWKSYQQNVLEKMKALATPLVIAGDARHDSMGHSAKYGAYTVFSCSLPLIITFSLVQRNVAGSSTAMEFLGFKECMAYLLGSGLTIGTIITDRHVSVRKYMREQLAHITHYFDLWHLKKKIHKVLTKISKESGGSDLVEWIKPCQNHFYWSATSTLSGNGKVIYAKFKSFLSHIINKHKNLDDPLFNKCAHGEIQGRKWLKKDSPVYEKICKALGKTSFVNAIKQASPLAQTSCLEGFHSVVNYFSPKMIAYSYVGMYCRHIIAAMHFNLNLQRDIRKRPDGSDQVKVTWPKFKNGEATVRDVRVNPHFEYVEDIYQSLLVAQQDRQLAIAVAELKNMTPKPMNTMLEKQDKEAAMTIREQRKEMKVVDVPPTASVTEAQNTNTRQTKTPRCSVCRNPMKGHKFVTDCPKNQK